MNPGVAVGIARLGKEISGITSSVDSPPPAILSAKLPILYVLTGEATDSVAEGTLLYEVRIFIVRVAVVSVGLASPDGRETRSRPILAAVKNEFRGRPNLGGTRGILDSKVVGDSGIRVNPDYDESFIGFDVFLNVTSVEEVEYKE